MDEPIVRAYPREDRMFRSDAEHALRGARQVETSMVEIEKRALAWLQANYPNATLHRGDDLASLGSAEQVWYAYRDGRVREHDWRRERLYSALAQSRSVMADSQRIMDSSRRLAQRGRQAS